MGIAVGLGMAAVVGGPLLAVLLVFWILRRAFRIPFWTLLPAILLGVALGPAAFDLVFPEYREFREANAVAPIIEVTIPDGFRGPLWVFHLERLPALPKGRPKPVVRASLDPTGKALVGYPTDRNYFQMRPDVIEYRFVHANGAPVDVTYSGDQLWDSTVPFANYFAGTEKERGRWSQWWFYVGLKKWENKTNDKGPDGLGELYLRMREEYLRFPTAEIPEATESH